MIQDTQNRSMNINVYTCNNTKSGKDNCNNGTGNVNGNTRSSEIYTHKKAIELIKVATRLTVLSYVTFVASFVTIMCIALFGVVLNIQRIGVIILMTNFVSVFP